MKIAIIEGGFHFEVVRSYALMLVHFGHDVTVLTNTATQNFIEQVLEQKIQWKIQANENFQTFLNRNQSFLNRQDVVICTSLETRDNQFIIKCWQSKSCIVVHDLHNDFDPFPNLSLWKKWSVMNLAKTIRYIGKGQFRKRKKALSLFNQILFPSSVMHHYAQINHYTQTALTLPFLWNEKIIAPRAHDVVKIVIPGSINQRSRDYEYVLDLMKNIVKQLTFKVELTILGNAASREAKEIVKKFQAIENDIFKLKSYATLVLAHEFDQVLMEADFLLLPLQSSWQFGVVDETGGLTCLSGNIGDMVRFLIPTILPDHYKIPPYLQPLTKRISMKDVENDTAILIDFIHNKKYTELRLNGNDVKKDLLEHLEEGITKLTNK